MTGARLVLAAALLGCGSGSGVVQPCEGDECGLPNLLLAAEILPSAAEPDLIPMDVRAEALVETDTGFRIEMRPPVEVSFYVVDGAPNDETGIPASIVVARPSLIPGRPSVVASSETDETGAAVMPLLPFAKEKLTYQIQVTPRPPLDQQYPRLVMTGVEISESMIIELPLGPASQLVSIDGCVVRLGSPKGAVYEPIRISGTFEDGTPTTSAVVDSQGCFRLLAHSFGNYTLHVRPPQDTAGARVDYEREIIPSRGSLVLELPALPDTQTYCLPVGGTNSAGNPEAIAGARVIFDAVIEKDPSYELIQAKEVSFRFEGTSDEKGIAHLELLPGLTDEPWIYTASIAPPPNSAFAAEAGLTYEIVLPAAASECPVLSQVDLGARRTVSGSLSVPGEDDDESFPVASASVEAIASSVVEQSSDPRPFAAPGTPQATTDHEGGFILWLDPGVYDLEIQPPPESGWPRWAVDRLAVDESVTDLAISLPEPKTAEVTVTQPGGDPVSGAIVRIFAIAKDAGQARLRGEGQTNDSGTAFVVLPNPE